MEWRVSENLKSKTEALLAKFGERCHRAGMKITPQRIAIYEVLASSHEHPSADSVYRKVKAKMPSISFDTVNRTLVKLSEIGAAFVVEGTGDVKRFDGNLEDHQHFKCVRCKKIFDYHHRPFDDIDLPEEVTGRFKVMRKTVYVEGICNDCADVN